MYASNLPFAAAAAAFPIGPAVRAKRANVEATRFPPSFKLRHAAKDLRLVDETAEELGLLLPAARAAREWFDEAMDRGAGDLDYSAVVATILQEEPAPRGDAPPPSSDAPPPAPH